MSFQEFRFCGYCSGDAEDFRFKYKLIDSDFTVEGITTGPRYTSPIGFGAGAVIDIYREKNLNVEGNVALFLLQQTERVASFNLPYLLNKCRSYFPQWKYIDEDKLKKYILFS
jgi:hypothetical protein